MDSTNVLHHDKRTINIILTTHFKNIFSTIYPVNVEEATNVVQGRVTIEMNLMHDQKLTKNEIIKAVMDMKSKATPGSDDLPTLFYKNTRRLSRNMLLIRFLCF